MTVRPIPEEYAEIFAWRREGGGVRPGTRTERPKYSSRSRSVATFPAICLLG